MPPEASGKPSDASGRLPEASGKPPDTHGSLREASGASRRLPGGSLRHAQTDEARPPDTHGSLRKPLICRWGRQLSSFQRDVSSYKLLIVMRK